MDVQDSGHARLKQEERIVCPARYRRVLRVARRASPCGTHPLRRIPIKVQTLALRAPAPIVLTDAGRKLQHVVRTAGDVVRSTGSADTMGRVSVVVQTLALMAPAPIVLIRPRIRL
jgi:hypothetical protein